MADYYYGTFYFKGRNKDIKALLESIEKKELKFGDFFSDPIIEEVSEGISQVQVCGVEQVKYAIKKFPNLKVCGFIEDFDRHRGYLAFSNCGETKIKKRFVGWFDPASELRWAYDESPLVDFKHSDTDCSSGALLYTSYQFKEKELWEADDYPEE